MLLAMLAAKTAEDQVGLFSLITFFFHISPASVFSSLTPPNNA